MRCSNCLHILTEDEEIVVSYLAEDELCTICYNKLTPEEWKPPNLGQLSGDSDE